MAACSENRASNSFESRGQRSHSHDRSGHCRLRNPGDANPVKVHLGQVGLSTPHRPLNLSGREAVTLSTPKHLEDRAGVIPSQMLMAIIEDHATIAAHRHGGSSLLR